MRRSKLCLTEGTYSLQLLSFPRNCSFTHLQGEFFKNRSITKKYIRLGYKFNPIFVYEVIFTHIKAENRMKKVIISGLRNPIRSQLPPSMRESVHETRTTLEETGKLLNLNLNILLTNFPPSETFHNLSNSNFPSTQVFLSTKRNIFAISVNSPLLCWWTFDYLL